MWQDKSLKLFGIYVIIRVKLQKCKLCHLLVWFGLVFITSAALHFYFPRGKVRTPQNSPLHINDWSSEGCQRKSQRSPHASLLAQKILVSIPCVPFRIWTLLPCLAALQDFISWSLIGAKINVLDKCQWYQFKIHLSNSLLYGKPSFRKKYKSGSPLCTFLVQDICNKNELF